MSESKTTPLIKLIGLPYEAMPASDGCPACGHDKQWMIIGPNYQMFGGQTWGDEDEATAISELLCDAYDHGVKDGQTN